MSDFIIPSFETFQKLRRERHIIRTQIKIAANGNAVPCAAKCNTPAADVPHTGRVSKEESSNLQPNISQPLRRDVPGVEQDNQTCPTNDNDDASMTQVGTAPENPQHLPQHQHQHPRNSFSQTNAHSPRGIKRKIPLTPLNQNDDASCCSSTHSSPLFGSRSLSRVKQSKQSSIDVSITKRVEEQKAMIFSPLSPENSPGCKEDEAKDNDDRQRGRSRKPWFQKRRGPKMKQTQLTFASAS